MHVVIMGTGGVGGIVGARLAQQGTRVSFVARGRHKEVMETKGLHLRSPRGDLHLSDVTVTDDPATLEPADVVVVGVKLYDVAEAARMIAPVLRPDTVVVPLLNGVDAPRVLPQAAGGVIRVSAVVQEPGVIAHLSDFCEVVVGPLAEGQRPVLEDFVEGLRQAGLTADLSDSIMADVWTKMVFLATFSGVTTLVRLPIGPIRRVPALVRLYQDALGEAAAVARAEGVALPAGIEAKVWTFTENLPEDMKSSMLMDLERGNRLESPWLSGTIARLGAAQGVATPVHATMAAALLPWADGARG